MRAIVVAGLIFVASCTVSTTVEGQKPLIDDGRSYSNAPDDRRYVAGRCAALYSEVAQTIAIEQPNMATAKSSDAREFLKRLPNPSEDTFLSWSREYKALLAAQTEAATTLWHSDYNACSGVLALIRSGDHFAKYTRDELRYLMGGNAKAALK